MRPLSSVLFVAIPIIAAICNLFLLLTFCSAKKDKLIRSFMLLLIAVTVWPVASFLMRVSLYPGETFWFQVSMTAIICVPLFIYMFIYHYVRQRGFIEISLLTAGTVLMAVLNLLHVFITDIQILRPEDGHMLFSYRIAWPSVFLIAFAALELALAARLIIRSISQGGMPVNSFMPFFIGTGIMFIAVVLDVVPHLASVFPLDPCACMINAILIYWMLYKKRVFTLTQFASNGSTYLVATVLTTLILLAGFRPAERIFDFYLSAYLPYKTLVFSVLFSVLTILVFTLLKKLVNNLFVKGEQAKQLTLKEFGSAINRSLERKEVVRLFTDLLRDNSDAEKVYVFTKTEEGSYEMASCSDPMHSLAASLDGESPLIRWLSAHQESISYNDFRHTANYKSMWEEEKDTLRRLDAGYALPVLCDGELLAVVILSARHSRKGYTYSEISFLESAASIVSIALKNADLYGKIRREARLDALTNLYNRRFFHMRFEETLKEHRHDNLALILFNFDDFKLYNELYGSTDGDSALVQFADLLRRIIGSRGVIGRYGGKEFAVCLPLCSGEQAFAYAGQVRAALNEALAAADVTTKKYLTFSAGVAAYPADASTAKDLLTYANLAVDTAKKSGKNRTVLYAKPDSGDELPAGRDVKAIGREYASTIYALMAAIDAKDHYTFRHSENVSYLSTQLAQAAGLSAEYAEMVRQAGLLHDIGKIGIDESILQKTTRLTPEEYAIMKQHVTNAIPMIRHLPSLSYVLPIAISHHERYDGKGYPRGLAGENIPIGGRCLGVADAFDAMVSRRPYKEGMPIPDALEEIERNLGTQFDPVLGRLFVDGVRAGTISIDCYSENRG